MESLRIAVADDESDMREFLQKALERLGHQVLGPAENGLELIELCKHQQPDLIITDIRMPEMNGDDALKEILAVRTIPYIVISAFGAPKAEKNLQHPDSVCLDKPVRMHDLKLAIDQICSS